MNTLDDLAPDVLARELEGRGYDSMWVPEHSHIPVSRRTPFPAGGQLPDQYKHMMDPFLSLLMAATATRELLVGTAVALPLQYDLLHLAKTVATLDQLSGGRLMFGVGVGWNQEELANHRPMQWAQRYRALGECVTALRTLWCDEESQFHGDFYDFDPVWSFPKPMQTPHPPVLCGTAGEAGTRQAVTWADGWLPTNFALGDVPKTVARFRQAVCDAGRDPSSVPITILALGDPDLATLAGYRDIGVERVIVGGARSGWDNSETTLPYLDSYAAMIPVLA